MKLENFEVQVGQEIIFHGMECVRQGSISWLVYGQVIAVTGKTVTIRLRETDVKQNFDTEIGQSCFAKTDDCALNWDELNPIWSADLKRWFCSKK